MLEEEYSRQIPFIGKRGQQKINKSRVAIIGLSGTGSHLAQQLSYLGVKNFLFVDPDVVSKTNLNRLIGATKKDVGRTKVNVAKSMATKINQESTIKKHKGTFLKKDVLAQLKEVDYMFGCVDKDGARLILNEFALAYNLPFIDLTTEINMEYKYYGGRVCTIPKNSDVCLHCLGVLSEDEIRRDLSTAEDREVNDKIYGVKKKMLGSSGPSVVSLNGFIASLAVTEFLRIISGYSQPHKVVNYRGDLNDLTKKNEAENKDCYYCKNIRGKKDKADIERYLRQGIDKILT